METSQEYSSSGSEDIRFTHLSRSSNTSTSTDRPKSTSRPANSNVAENMSQSEDSDCTKCASQLCSCLSGEEDDDDDDEDEDDDDEDEDFFRQTEPPDTAIEKGSCKENDTKVSDGNNNNNAGGSSDLFPWLDTYKKMCINAIIQPSIKGLDDAMKFYIKHASVDIKCCYMKPNRASKLRKNLSDALMFFYVHYVDLKPVENTFYLNNMSIILSYYLDMEIKASRRGKESVKKIASKLVSCLYLFLDKSIDHILDSILFTELMIKGYREVCIPVLSKVLEDVRMTESCSFLSSDHKPALTYARYTLAFKLWKRIVRGAEGRRQINQLAIMRLEPPPSNLREVIRKGVLNSVLPNIPKSRKDVTQFLIQAKFNAKEKAQEFFKVTRNSSQFELLLDTDRCTFFSDDYSSSDKYGMRDLNSGSSDNPFDLSGMKPILSQPNNNPAPMSSVLTLIDDIWFDVMKPAKPHRSCRNKSRNSEDRRRQRFVENRRKPRNLQRQHKLDSDSARKATKFKAFKNTKFRKKLKKKKLLGKGNNENDNHDDNDDDEDDDNSDDVEEEASNSDSDSDSSVDELSNKDIESSDEETSKLENISIANVPECTESSSKDFEEASCSSSGNTIDRREKRKKKGFTPSKSVSKSKSSKVTRKATVISTASSPMSVCDAIVTVSNTDLPATTETTCTTNTIASCIAHDSIACSGNKETVITEDSCVETVKVIKSEPADETQMDPIMAEKHLLAVTEQLGTDISSIDLMNSSDKPKSPTTDDPRSVAVKEESVELQTEPVMPSVVFGAQPPVLSHSPLFCSNTPRPVCSGSVSPVPFNEDELTEKISSALTIGEKSNILPGVAASTASNLDCFTRDRVMKSTKFIRVEPVRQVTTPVASTSRNCMQQPSTSSAPSISLKSHSALFNTVDKFFTQNSRSVSSTPTSIFQDERNNSFALRNNCFLVSKNPMTFGQPLGSFTNFKQNTGNRLFVALNLPSSSGSNNLFTSSFRQGNENRRLIDMDAPSCSNNSFNILRAPTIFDHRSTPSPSCNTMLRKPSDLINLKIVDKNTSLDHNSRILAASMLNTRTNQLFINEQLQPIRSPNFITQCIPTTCLEMPKSQTFNKQFTSNSNMSSRPVLGNNLVTNNVANFLAGLKPQVAYSIPAHSTLCNVSSFNTMGQRHSAAEVSQQVQGNVNFVETSRHAVNKNSVDAMQIISGRSSQTNSPALQTENVNHTKSSCRAAGSIASFLCVCDDNHSPERSCTATPADSICCSQQTELRTNENCPSPVTTESNQECPTKSKKSNKQSLTRDDSNILCLHKNNDNATDVPDNVNISSSSLHKDNLSSTPHTSGNESREESVDKVPEDNRVVDDSINDKNNCEEGSNPDRWRITVNAAKRKHYDLHTSTDSRSEVNTSPNSHSDATTLTDSHSVKRTKYSEVQEEDLQYSTSEHNISDDKLIIDEERSIEDGNNNDDEEDEDYDNRGAKVDEAPKVSDNSSMVADEEQSTEDEGTTDRGAEEAFVAPKVSNVSSVVADVEPSTDDEEPADRGVKEVYVSPKVSNISSVVADEEPSTDGEETTNIGVKEAFVVPKVSNISSIVAEEEPSTGEEETTDIGGKEAYVTPKAKNVSSVVADEESSTDDEETIDMGVKEAFVVPKVSNISSVVADEEPSTDDEETTDKGIKESYETPKVSNISNVVADEELSSDDEEKVSSRAKANQTPKVASASIRNDKKIASKPKDDAKKLHTKEHTPDFTMSKPAVVENKASHSHTGKEPIVKKQVLRMPTLVETEKRVPSIKIKIIQNPVQRESPDSKDTSSGTESLFICEGSKVKRNKSKKKHRDREHHSRHRSRTTSREEAEVVQELNLGTVSKQIPVSESKNESEYNQHAIKMPSEAVHNEPLPQARSQEEATPCEESRYRRKRHSSPNLRKRRYSSTSQEEDSTIISGNFNSDSNPTDRTDNVSQPSPNQADNCTYPETSPQSPQDEINSTAYSSEFQHEAIDDCSEQDSGDKTSEMIVLKQFQMTRADADKLHVATCEIDRRLCMSQFKFRDYFSEPYNVFPSIPVPYPTYIEDALEPKPNQRPTRCPCIQCSENLCVLIANYKKLTHYRNTTWNNDVEFRKNQNERLIRQIEKSLGPEVNDEHSRADASRWSANNTPELDCSLPLKKRKTFAHLVAENSDSSNNVQEPEEPVEPTRLIDNQSASCSSTPSTIPVRSQASNLEELRRDYHCSKVRSSKYGHANILRSNDDNFSHDMIEGNYSNSSTSSNSRDMYSESSNFSHEERSKHSAIPSGSSSHQSYLRNIQRPRMYTDPTADRPELNDTTIAVETLLNFAHKVNSQNREIHQSNNAVPSTSTVHETSRHSSNALFSEHKRKMVTSDNNETPSSRQLIERDPRIRKKRSNNIT